MKTLIKLLALLFVFAAFMTCSDDDDNPPIIINDIMVVYNSNSGAFSAIDLTDGSLEFLGTVTYDGQVLTGLRDFVYYPQNNTVYASSRSDHNYGAIFSINPETLEAIRINSNDDDNWYAVHGIEIYNGKILGTVYWDEFNDDNNLGYYQGMVILNLDGSISSYMPLWYEGDELSFYEGMALDYGATPNQILTTRWDEVIVADTAGNVSQIIELDGVNFPDEHSLDGIRTLEHSEDGVLYGIDRDNHFGRIDLTNATFTYIATLMPEDDRFVSLSMIPENIIED